MKKKIVITLSRVFPVTHSRKGEDTNFCENLISGVKKELNIYAYQLQIGDLVHCWEGWYLVFGLKGSYVRGRGLLVDIKFHDGWHHVECLSQLKVCRYV